MASRDYGLLKCRRNCYEIQRFNQINQLFYSPRFRAYSDVVDNQKTLVITQNGEAKVVVQDVRQCEQMQESLALLKILAMSSKNIKEGNVKPIHKAFDDLDKRIKEHQAV